MIGTEKTTTIKAPGENEYDRRIVERTTTKTGEFQLTKIRLGRETHYELIMNGVFLMATYNAPSCRVLADAALFGMTERRHVEVLIGGLGMGFALRHMLGYQSVRRACVVELEPKIIDWNRHYLGNEQFLDDPRTELVVGDFFDYVQGNPRSYNGIALDVDNGPDWVVRSKNRRVYSLSMLELLKSKLRSEGVLAIWSHSVSSAYEKALAQVFGEVNTMMACDYDLNGKPIESVIYAVRL